MFYIYTIINVQNYKIYVGQTKNILARWSSHKYEAKANKLQYPLYKALRKYGFEKFQITIVDIAKNGVEADLFEQEWIKKLESRNLNMGYNLSPGGAVARGWHHSEESKRKISKSLTGRTFIMSEDTKNKISISNIGRTVSEETRNKISSKNKGKIKSEESKEKNRIAHLGKTASAETKNKMSSSQIKRQQLGIKISNLAKLNIDTVEKIRKECAEGKLSQRKIANKYNVSRITIYRIIHNQTWKSTVPILI